MWWTPETAGRLMAHFRLDSEQQLRDRLGVDLAWLWVEPLPAPAGRPAPADLPPGAKVSYWGFATREVRYRGGSYQEYCHHPLAGAEDVADVEAHAWPDPAAFDYDALPTKIAAADAAGEKWIGVGESSIFERSWALVGLERFLEGLLLRPAVMRRIMSRVNDFYIEQTLRTLRACGGRADMVYTADDVGSQLGMILGPTLWRREIKPLQKELNDAVRAEFPGVVIHYHSCGSIVPIIDDLIEIGVDVLNPIQPAAAGMDAETLAGGWGGRLCFCGGLDTQHLLPRGTARDVWRECARLIRVLGAGGGYILAPAHAVQVDVPVENVLAIFEAARGAPPEP